MRLDVFWKQALPVLGFYGLWFLGCTALGILGLHVFRDGGLRPGSGPGLVLYTVS